MLVSLRDFLERSGSEESDGEESEELEKIETLYMNSVDAFAKVLVFTLLLASHFTVV